MAPGYSWAFSKYFVPLHGCVGGFTDQDWIIAAGTELFADGCQPNKVNLSNCVSFTEALSNQPVSSAYWHYQGPCMYRLFRHTICDFKNEKRTLHSFFVFLFVIRKTKTDYK